MKTTSLVKSFTVKLISRNNSHVRQKFRKPHTMTNTRKFFPSNQGFTVWSLRNFCITWEIFREINFTVKLFTKEVTFTKFFQKNRDTKISQTPQRVHFLTKIS